MNAGGIYKIIEMKTYKYRENIIIAVKIYKFRQKREYIYVFLLSIKRLSLKSIMFCIDFIFASFLTLYTSAVFF